MGKFAIGFGIGVILTAVLFSKIIQAEHNANRSLYGTLNKCDQALKKALND